MIRIYKNENYEELENYIKENVKNFIILRMPIVLTKFNYYVKYMKLNRNVDFITIDNFNAIVIQVMENKKIYGKTFNISGFKANSTVFLKNMYKYTGRLHLSRRNIYYGEYSDDDFINKYVDVDEGIENKILREIASKSEMLL